MSAGDDSVERGEPVSVLVAAEYPIYGRYGYGPATEACTLRLDATARWVGEQTGRVEIVDAETWAGLLGRPVRPAAPPQPRPHQVAPGAVAHVRRPGAQLRRRRRQPAPARQGDLARRRRRDPGCRHLRRRRGLGGQPAVQDAQGRVAGGGDRAGRARAAAVPDVGRLGVAGRGRAAPDRRRHRAGAGRRPPRIAGRPVGPRVAAGARRARRAARPGATPRRSTW